ncbi:hypothetical protein QQA43_31490 (plasmid) [Mycolicibacterium vanbaalenii]|uniref:hypothetical protein n=1 Tax=Mycolicibacterium vanbaalenii TaxID=110539 RepID=UPI002877876D|nr:hypothetical protein [Mycolicibacterium vanbaalenii]WND60394.1 hypothetical protein QQA43_31490 [Mycolicibacterium vanbaalenii]
MPAASGGAKPIEVLPAAVTGTAQVISGEVSRSAQPGPAPVPGGLSASDAATNAIAAAVAENVAHCSATLAPEPIEGVQKAETATTELRGQDTESAADIRSVAQTMQPPPGASGGGGTPSIRPVSNTGADSWHWEYDHNGLMVRVDDVEPVDPGGAAGGGFGGLAPVGP